AVIEQVRLKFFAEERHGKVQLDTGGQPGESSDRRVAIRHRDGAVTARLERHLRDLGAEKERAPAPHVAAAAGGEGDVAKTEQGNERRLVQRGRATASVREDPAGAAAQGEAYSLGERQVHRGA